MKSRTATWFECKVRYEQIQENGSGKISIIFKKLKVGSIYYVEVIFAFYSRAKCKLKRECSELHD